MALRDTGCLPQQTTPARTRRRLDPVLDRSGQALVEMSLLLPLLLVLATAAIDGGQLMMASVAMTNAAAAGARVAANDFAHGDAFSQITADAVQAARSEGASLVCSGVALPAGCVGVHASVTPDGTPDEVVTVYDTPALIIPIGSLTLSAQGAAAP
jgi:Flp pilus assembly protein TadG